MEKQCVFCEVYTEFLNVMFMNFMFYKFKLRNVKRVCFDEPKLEWK